MKPGICAALAVAVMTCGCGLHLPASAPRTAGAKSARLTADELRTALDDFQQGMEYAVAATARRIQEQARDNEVRKRCLVWQIQTAASLQAVVKQPAPLQAFLQTWILCVRMAQAAATDYYKEVAGEFQPLVAQTAQQAVVEIEQLGHLLLTPAEFEETKRDVEAFAAEHPIAGTYSGPLLHEIAFETSAQLRFTEILNVSLSPFKPLEKGVDRGAEAIHEFTVVAERFADIVYEWPQMMNWQLQLLLLQAATENDSVRALLHSASQIGDSSQRLAASSESLARTAQELPARLGDELASREQTVSALLGEVRDTTARLDHFVQQIEAAAGRVEATAQSAAEAGQAWTATAGAIREMVAYFTSLKGGSDGGAGGAAAAPSPAGSSDSALSPHTGTAAPPSAPGAADRGYDILDYEKTAVALTAAAAELRALTTQVRDLTESPGWVQRLAEVESSLQEAVGQAALRADRVTDHLAWRGVQLIILAFGLALAYRWICSRVQAPAR